MNQFDFLTDSYVVMPIWLYCYAGCRWSIGSITTFSESTCLVTTLSDSTVTVSDTTVSISIVTATFEDKKEQPTQKGWRVTAKLSEAISAKDG